MNIALWKLKTLFEPIKSMKPPDCPEDKPLRLDAQDNLYKIGDIGTVPFDPSKTGVLIPGMVWQ